MRRGRTKSRGRREGGAHKGREGKKHKKQRRSFRKEKTEWEENVSVWGGMGKEDAQEDEE